MKYHLLRLYFLLALLLPCGLSYAATFTTYQSGNWTNPATWNEAGFPSSTDDVIIDGATVTIDATDGNITINSIVITNASNTATSRLNIQDGVTVTVTLNLVASAGNKAQDVILNTINTSVLNISGNIFTSRAPDNIQTNLLQLKMENSSRINVSGNYTLNYGNGAASDGHEIYMLNDAILDIDGSLSITNSGTTGTASVYTYSNSQMLTNSNFTATLSGGDKIEVSIDDSSVFHVSGDVSLSNSGGSDKIWIKASDTAAGAVFSVGGEVDMNSTGAGKTIEVSADGASTVIDIDGDINMTASTQSALIMDFTAGSTLKLGGNINRISNYGSITMDNTSIIEFNGSVSQGIPASNLVLSGTDEFTFTNVKFNNTSGVPMSLSGDLTVSEHLDLTSGIIETSNSKLIIIEDGATISAGSNTAYIDGPMKKVGSTNASPFIFPTGDNNIYAPIEMAAVSNPAYEYTAEYFACPPPTTDLVNAPLAHRSRQEYWSFQPGASSASVNITLHWKDAARSGIDDLATLVVAQYNATTGWHARGNGGTTGSTGLGASGSLSNDLFCPPPTTDDFFTFGSTNPATNMQLLPVELVRFDAFRKHNIVHIQWETSSEVNTSHFAIERSVDGMNFTTLGETSARGNTSTNAFYSTQDTDPAAGLNYYRLMIVDEDGSMEWSDLKVINFQDAQAPVMFPNPVKEFFQIQSDETTENEVTIEVFDHNGRMIFSDILPINNGRIGIYTKHLNINYPGSYFLQFTNKSGSYTLPFIKVK